MDQVENESPKRPDIYESLKSAVSDGLEIVRKVEAEDRPIDTYEFYPDMSYYDPGFPRFSFARKGQGPKDYKSLFRDYVGLFEEFLFKAGTLHLSKDIPSWQEFRELARNDEHLKRYWGPSELFMKLAVELPGTGDIYEAHTVFGAIKSLLDRYIHMTKQTECKEELFKPIYLEWEHAIFDQELRFDILVPIIRVKFAFDRLQLAGGVSIERMSDDIQLSRGKRRSSSMSAHDDVIIAATHALVLKNWVIANGETYDERVATLGDVAAYSKAITLIDKFFAAVRAVAGVETGYCQVLARRMGWADHWEADLTPLSMMSVRAYPDQFERIYWGSDTPELDSDVCSEVGKLYNALAQSSSNKLTLAAKRLNAASLRSEEQDSILDITIGLEALLGDKEKGEITHKLATRMAALCKIEKFKEHTPAEVFGFCKKLYGYRSAVAHGEHEVDKKRVIKLEEEKTVPAVELGIELLRFALRVLSSNPTYLDSHKLDLHLVS